MSKRTSHSDETKAAAMAALLQGQSITSVAKEYKIPRGTVSGWASKVRNGDTVGGLQPQKSAEIGELLTNYLAANLRALCAQAQAFQDPDWLAKQSASDAAVLHGVMTDKAVRLLEAFGQAEGADDSD